MQVLIDLILNGGTTVIIPLFFKVFAIFLAILFLVYSLFVVRQTKVMNETFTTKNAGIVIGVSYFQLMLAVLLLIVAIFLI